MTVRLAKKSTRPKPTAIKSFLPKGRLVYQVLLGCLPKPRSSMALEMVSMRFKLVRIRGSRILTEFFIRLKKGSLLPNSTPLACWAWLMLW